MLFRSVVRLCTRMDNTPETKISPHTCPGNILARRALLCLKRAQSTFQDTEHLTRVKQSQILNL